MQPLVSLDSSNLQDFPINLQPPIVQMFSKRLHYSLLFTILQFMLSSSMATSGKIPAIIVFGDSTVDTGNNNNRPTISKANFPPYGRDFDGGIATGRFSNGRLVTDFISEFLGLPPTVPAYLDTSYTIDQLATGVTFASGGSGLDNLTAAIMSAIPLRQQLQYFNEYKEKLKLALGESTANMIITEALYCFSIGHVDILQNVLLGRLRSAPEYVTNLVSHAEAAIRDIYYMGARKIVFTGLVPVGCTPIVMTLTLQEPGHCNEEYNQLAQRFNSELQEAVSKLNGELVGVQVVYSETYSVVSRILANPSDYGFANSVQGCCGTGLIEMGFLCRPEEPLMCQDDTKYVFFDSVHPTEGTFKIVANEFLENALTVFL